jgi:hypothetical protein
MFSLLLLQIWAMLGNSASWAQQVPAGLIQKTFSDGNLFEDDDQEHEGKPGFGSETFLWAWNASS